MFGICKKEFSCRRGELQIRGTFFMPRDAPEMPAAIVCHEFMANRFASYPYAKTLAKCGYAAFTFDFCGGSTFGRSDGDTRNMSVLTEKEDLRAVLAYVRERPGIRQGPVLLMGCSQGGFVAALVAADIPEEIAGLILVYPAFSIPDDARRGEMLAMRFDPSNVPEELRCGPIRIGRQYVADVQDMDAFDAISGYSGKVLIIHGDKDKVVDATVSERAAEAYGKAGADVNLQIIPGGGHVFRNPRALHMAESFVAAFADSLRAPSCGQL